jgi:hypothetical protein
MGGNNGVDPLAGGQRNFRKKKFKKNKKTKKQKTRLVFDKNMKKKTRIKESLVCINAIK